MEYTGSRAAQGRVCPSNDVTYWANGHWDATGVQRILENLAGNAVKYGAADAEIILRLERTQASVRISVENKGKPIAAEDQSTLFDAYRRTHSALAGGQKGWGIGLSLVKGLAEAQILRVRKDKKGVITHYEVADLGWFSKAEATGFASAGEIDVVIATPKSGRLFLRTRPDVTVVSNLKSRG